MQRRVRKTRFFIGSCHSEEEKRLKNLTFSAGVDGSVAVGGGGDAGGAFLGGGIDRLQKNLKPKFFVLLGHLREAGFIHGEAFFPAFLLKFFFSGHLGFLIHPHPPLSIVWTGVKGYRCTEDIGNSF